MRPTLCHPYAVGFVGGSIIFMCLPQEFRDWLGEQGAA
jgi:hypothetical protein